jgi:t-SNARE complex subunit (syntaxin)
MNDNYVTYDLITERENDIDVITREILDINEIFQTLNTVVEQQGYLIDHIEHNVNNVIINVENSNNSLESANKKQENTGNWLWWIFLILIVILLIIVLICF